MIQLRKNLWVDPHDVSIVEVMPHRSEVHIRVRDHGTVVVGNDYGMTPHATAQRLVDAINEARKP